MRHRQGLGMALAIGCALAAPAAAQMKYDGVTVNVVTFTGPQIAEPLQRRAPDFKALTGANVNVITVPFSDLYSKLLTDFATGTNSYDATVFAPQWMVDFIEPGYLEDITDKVKADGALEWNDIGPFFRDFSATYNGRVYTIPLDGDFQMVYYRSDLLKDAGMAAPRTWDDYIAIAKAFHGKDLDGDGKPDYGSCITSGRCALTIDWGDIGTLAIDPDTSKVQDKVGAVILPGSSQILDRASGQLADCTPQLCPHAADGINHAPFAAFGGWSGAINAAKDRTVKDAAYDFLSYMSQPAQANVDVTIGRTGFNPYRISQFENIDLWVEAGMGEAAARDYLGAIEQSLNSPNMVLDLRVPQNQRYQQIVLDTAIARLLAGEIDVDQAAEEIETGWNEITEELGREEQLRAYRGALGLR
jgi:ABC-type glycerol-3-phosphate transport system substrate-binding protein